MSTRVMTTMKRKRPTKRKEKAEEDSIEPELAPEERTRFVVAGADEDSHYWRSFFIHKRKENLMSISAKIAFLTKLLPKLKKDGHRVLIFSQSKKMLGFIEFLLRQNAYTSLRLDGDITRADERQRRIDMFNNDKKFFCFLLTTLVGGIGLNLTGADRVIIVDPSWNPTHDNQVSEVKSTTSSKFPILIQFLGCVSRVQVGTDQECDRLSYDHMRYHRREDLSPSSVRP
jgi:SNF2 family DNA or RNA helicase